MLTGHNPRTYVLLAATSLLAGCAQPGPILSRYTTVGTLKTSLSHLEFENQQLRTKVATLESETRDIENRLVQEESANGDLSARLDDARNVITQNGSSWGGTNQGGSPAPALPAGRSNRTPRKPPYARVPGRSSSSNSGDGFDDEFNRPAFPSAEALGPQSMRNDDSQWLPIARGAAATATKVR